MHLVRFSNVVLNTSVLSYFDEQIMRKKVNGLQMTPSAWKNLECAKQVNLNAMEDSAKKHAADQNLENVVYQV